MEAMAEDLKDLEVSGATTPFTHEEPLSWEPIERILEAWMNEIGFA